MNHTLAEIYTREKLFKLLLKEKQDASRGKEFETLNSKSAFGTYTADEDYIFGSVQVIKGQELRYILGVVLEPETIDATRTEKTIGDIYNEDEVRKAAHWFMLNYKGQGNDFMHDGKDTPSAFQIVESFVSPIEMQLGTENIKKGTWLMATLVFDEKVWTAIKEGGITGYSIGGVSNARIEGA